MIEWIKIESGAPRPNDGDQVIFYAKKTIRIGVFHYPEGSFYEIDTGLVFFHHSVTHWAIANEPDGD